MSLVCTMCGAKAIYKLFVDTGRFTNSHWYCKNHRPCIIQVGILDKEQHDEPKEILLSVEVRGTDS